MVDDTDPKPGSDHPDALASVYLRHHRLKDDADFWAWDQAHDYLRTDPERAWEVLLALVRQAEWDELDYVGAGLLEDLCQNNGKQFIDRIEAQAKADPKFKAALSNVWLNTLYAPPEIVERLVTASEWTIEPFELDYDKPGDAASLDDEEGDSGLTSA